MTEKKNEQGSEPGRPSWAAGLDLSPQAVRPTDETIKAWMWGQELVLRRLALAEMRVAELTEELRRTRRDFVQVTERGEPDFLIDRDGDAWTRTDFGRYRWLGNDGTAPGRYRWLGNDGTTANQSREWIDDNFGPVVEVWK